MYTSKYLETNKLKQMSSIKNTKPYLDAETSKLVENTKATEKENNHK